MLLAGLLTVYPEQASAANRPSSWAFEDVRQAMHMDLIPDGLQSDYQQAITRAELSSVIVKLYERLTGSKAALPATNPFKDTKDPNVLKAYGLGIVGGISATKFSPDALVTREQLAVMLYSTLTKSGLKEKLAGSEPTAFADGSSIAAWAAEAASKLAGAGILKGTQTKEGLKFQPKANASREQIFSLAYRIADSLGPVYVGSEYGLLDAIELRDRSYIFTDARTKKIYDEAARIVSELVKPGMSDFEKELAIHDYIVLHAEYDYDNYLADTIPDDSYSAYGILFHGTAVCQGYAYAAHLMLEMAGIDSQIVTGTANGGGHAWNKVKIDGEYYNLDVTWDDPVPDKQGRLVYNYFNVTDEELAKDHIWQRSNWPEATSTAASYYEKMGMVVHSSDELHARIASAINARQMSVELKASYDGNEWADMEAALESFSNILAEVSVFHSVDKRVIRLTFTYL
ncbi:hypothetical protein PCURB6_02090 [Paenibacillus curdlanolyticus]|nr:hypothetical protein PCURB6_02090 [Paenibacillus curdlanolyticus]